MHDERDTLAGVDLNTMTAVTALGFDDMPPHAFAVAYDLIFTPGLPRISHVHDGCGDHILHRSRAAPQKPASRQGRPRR